MNDSRYSMVQLNAWSDRAWGVISRSGELVRNADSSFRMRKGEARALANRLNAGGAGVDPAGLWAQPALGFEAGRDGVIEIAPR